MRILYYTWNENSAQDCIDCMKDLGHDVTVFRHAMKSYTQDDEFESALAHSVPGFDLVFTYNYFPTISRVCEDMKIPYVSWVYDSPHLTLESLTLSNSCNRVFLFDRGLVEKYHVEGFPNVHYMPLGYYDKRISRLTGDAGLSSHSHFGSGADISFIGSLYNDEYNFLDQIKGMPDSLRGYIDAIISAQLELQGSDIIDSLFGKEKCNELGLYANAALGSDYCNCRDEIFRDMIRRKATVLERPKLLDLLGQHFPVDLYSGAEPPADLHVNFRGYAENHTQMPAVFNSSRINLNLTLRTIRTGIPLRIIDILGAGGFCLTNYQAELEDYFVNEKELVWFYSPEDMLEKVTYYLDPAHEEERAEIAQKGHEKAKEMFSLEVLLPKILG